MLPLERQNRILELLAEHQAMTVDELCRRLYSSGATIRRDLQVLEKGGMLARTHGGAVRLDSAGGESPANLRENEHMDLKALIADRAADLIPEGSTVFLDASTTACHLAQRLKHYQNLRVITNGLKTASILASSEGVQVYGTGGRLRENAHSFVGSHTLAFINQYHADFAVFSCRGIHPEGGITESSEEEADVKRRYLSNAAQSILLCDESKLGRQFFCRVAPVNSIWRIICNIPLPPEYGRE